MNGELLYLVDTGNGLYVQNIYYVGDHPSSVLITLDRSKAFALSLEFVEILARVVSGIGLDAKVVLL